MSRVGKKPVELGKDVSAEVQGRSVTIKGKKGSLTLDVELRGRGHASTAAVVKVAPRSGSNVRQRDGRHDARAPREHGHGRHEGLREEARARRRRLPRRRAGQEAEPDARLLAPRRVSRCPQGITIETPSQNEIIVKGMDRQQVGQVAAEMRDYRPPEPYKGKGVTLLRTSRSSSKKRRRSSHGDRQESRNVSVARAALECGSRCSAFIGCACTARRSTSTRRSSRRKAIACVASASTLNKELRGALKGTGNIAAAAAVGKEIAERAKAGRRREGRVRPLGLQVSRPHQSARRRGARSGPQVLSAAEAERWQTNMATRRVSSRSWSR